MNTSKAQVDFLCLEDTCKGLVKFNLIDVAETNFQVSLPHGANRSSSSTSGPGRERSAFPVSLTRPPPILSLSSVKRR